MAPKTTEPVRSAPELLERYAGGERLFLNAEINGADDLSGQNLQGIALVNSNLTEIDLSGADLRGAAIIGSNLKEALLVGANLTGAVLNQSTLRHAELSGARLIDAGLDTTDLAHACLRGAVLDGSYLFETTIMRADLSESTYNRATLGMTAFVDVDLAGLCRAEELTHEAPSSIDQASILRSIREPLLRHFLCDAGMPQVFVEYNLSCAQSLDPEALFSMLQSVFISYGAPDEAFAARLNRALLAEGVRTYFFKEDAEPGQKLHRLMRTGVNTHDRVILICSEASLKRPGLLNELEETLQRESREGGQSYLVPVRVDDFVFTSGWSQDRPDLR